MFGSSSQLGYSVVAPGPASDAAVEEAALVVAAQADPREFTRLYELYVGPIYRYCFVRLGSREAAEDATSEVFMKALGGLDCFHGGLFSAWLFKIAQNTVIDARRRHHPSDPIEAAGDPRDPSLSPEELAVTRSEVEELKQAMLLLPDDQRVALELRLAGWSGVQIAAILGKSVDAVKMLRYRAVARLRSVLTHPELELREGHDD